MDLSRAIPLAAAGELDRWLAQNADHEREVIVAIYKKSSGKQTVTLPDLQATALCHGWVDTQTMRIDDERYAIRFVPRRPGSSWGSKNRQMAVRLLSEGRVLPGGLATLPEDLR